MEIRFTPSEEDDFDAVRAVGTPGYFMFLFVLLLALLFLVGVYLMDHGHALAGCLWLAMSVVIGIAVYELPRIQLSRSLKNNPSLKGEIVIALKDQGTVATFPTGEARLDWRAYTKYKETGFLFLLFFSQYRYTAIPKRAMSPEQIEEMRVLLKGRILPR